MPRPPLPDTTPVVLCLMGSESMTSLCGQLSVTGGDQAPVEIQTGCAILCAGPGTCPRPGRVGTSKHTQAASCLRYIPLSCESSPPFARPLELSCCAVQAVSAVFRPGEAVCSVAPHPRLPTQTNTCHLSVSVSASGQ